MKRTRHSGWVSLLLFACAWPRAGCAEDGAHYFQMLTQSEGLSESNVTAVAQDHDGFIWLGTQDGLDRYDGYGLRIFRHGTNSPDSISDSYVTTLYVDDDGTLWIGTRNGLDRYDAGTEAFSRFLNSDSNPIGIGHIAEARPGFLWLATDHGLLLFDRARGSYQRMGPAQDVVDAPLLHDHADMTWMGTRSGLVQLDATTGRPQPFLEATFGHARITALYEAHDQALWVGTADGAIYSIASGRGMVEPFPQITPLTRSAVTGFADSPDGSLWVGTQDHGLVSRRFDGDWIHIGMDRSTAHGLPSDHITGVIIDGGGNLWVALQNPGVARYNPRANRFQKVTTGRSAVGVFRPEVVRSIAFDGQHRLWLGTETGIEVFDENYRRVRSFPLRAKGHAGLSGSYVETLFLDHRGEMWVGLRDGGLCGLLPGLDRFSCYRHRAGDPHSLSDDDVIAIAEDRDGALWLGTLNGGLVRFDPMRAQFRGFRNDPKDPHSLSSNKITSVVADADGSLWLGTYGGGLNHFDPKTGAASHYHTGIDPSRALSSNNVVTLLKTDPQTLWVATTGGLDRLDIRSGTVRAWTMADGLPNDLVFAMVADTLGSLWLGTNNGLAQFDPAKGVVHTYSQYDGLPADEFAFGSAARSIWGTVFMGTVAGLVAFNPVELTSVNTPVSMRFTSLTSYGAAVLPGAADGLLQTSITEAKELRLPYTTPEINLEFAALNAPNPSRERYAYRLAGLDDRWTYLEPGRHSVGFSALPAGEFVLEVRPIDAAATAPLQLRITVPPPPWRSPWAYAVYLLMLSALLLAFGWWQRRRLALERSQAALSRENEARLQLALWASGEGTWDLRRPERTIYCPELMQSLGYNDMPQPLSGPVFLQLLHPDDRDVQYERYQEQLLSEAGVIDIEFRIRKSTGEYVWWKMHGKVVERDRQGGSTRAIGMAKDISADKEQQTRLQLAALFMENSSDSIAVLDQGYRIIKVNRAFETMTGYSEAEVLGKYPAFLSAAQDGDARIADIRELLGRKGSWSGEGWIRRSNGENFLGRTQVNAVRDEHGNISHFVGITADITRQRLYEDELRHLASHDALTGLPNRALLSDRLGHAIASSEGDHVGVVLLSLDSFSRINDSLGHDVGDEVLRETSRRLLRAVSPGDTVSRVGGDTFALLLVARDSEQTVQQVVVDVLRVLAEPVLAAGETLYLSASAGISLYPRDGEEPGTLVKNAESALFKSKLRNRGAHTWYSPSMGAEAKGQLEMHTSLHRALERGELSVHYQPKLRTLTGEICGVEALVRWHDTELHWISPSEFIPVAEMYGLIDKLGEWVLRTACREIHSLGVGAAATPINLAVNLSPKQIQQPDLPARIAAILTAEGFPTERLALEITENVLMHNAAESAEMLKQLRARGILFAIDDFGTGYSSLGYLRHFPISEIKVDKSFVQDMENRYTLAIIKAIVALGRSLRMEVTAEGVENRAQAEALSALGCTQLQGFFIAPPMDRDALAEFLAGRTTVYAS